LYNQLLLLAIFDKALEGDHIGWIFQAKNG